MTDLTIIVPSRGRPAQLRELLIAIRDTATTDVRVLVGLDDDDEADYSPLLGLEVDALVYRRPRLLLSAKTNMLAWRALDSAAPPRFLAFLGDDHRPRTPGWDKQLIEAIGTLGGPGWAYGDDLLQHGALPTAWVQSAQLVDVLGWMMLPACQHMYVDNAVLELGRAAGRIAYCPEVVVEHLHPVAGKADWDASYRESNSPQRYARDRAFFDAWLFDALATDAEKVRHAR